MGVVPKTKKLPFKPTALRKAPPPQSSPSDEENGSDDLLLFRRSKEMERVIEADRERKLRRKQKQEEERRRLSLANSKRSLDEEQNPGDPADENGGGGIGGTTVHAAGTEAQLEASDRMAEALETDEVHTAGEESFRELVTPPPSKRTRREPPSPQSHLDAVDQDLLSPYASPSANRRLSQRETVVDNAIETAGEASTSIADTPTKSLDKGKTPIRGGPQIISIDSDSDGDDDIRILATPSKQKPSMDQGETATSALDDGENFNHAEEEEDDEFAEYVRKAEQQRARALLEAQTSATDRDSPQPRDKVEIVVMSEFPDAKPARVLFLYDKPLRVVRDSWIAIQVKKGLQLPIEKHDDIVLTWRRKKVYTSSSLVNLGIRPDGSGRVVVSSTAYDGRRTDGLTDNRTRVLMEAWTPDLFRKMEHEEELRRRSDDQDGAGEAGDDDDIETQDQAHAPEVKVRVTLRARELDDVKLAVRPETTVETLVTGFRKQRSVGPGQDVSIWFDGERLDEHVSIAEADIDDLDTLEVHIK